MPQDFNDLLPPPPPPPPPPPHTHIHTHSATYMRRWTGSTWVQVMACFQSNAALIAEKRTNRTNGLQWSITLVIYEPRLRQIFNGKMGILINLSYTATSFRSHSQLNWVRRPIWPWPVAGQTHPIECRSSQNASEPRHRIPVLFCSPVISRTNSTVTGAIRF